MVNPLVVAPPARTPFPYGLFSVLTFRNDGRWLNGVTWPATAPDAAATVHTVDYAECAPLNIAQPERISRWPESTLNATVSAGAKCTLIGTSAADIEAQAVEVLTSTEEREVEKAVYARYVTDPADPVLNPTEAVDGTDVERAIGIMELRMAQEYVGQGTLHVSRALLPQIEGYLTAQGGVLRTKGGTPVVAGTGYPDGAIFTLPPTVAYRSEVTLLGDTDQTFDRGTNDQRAIATRDYVLGIDPGPVHTFTATL